MSEMPTHPVRRRSVADRAISGAKALWYASTEPRTLCRARAACEADYAVRNESPLISVYIPTYNRVRLLMERSLSSLLAQTYANFEVIVVGDCCTDNTAKEMANIKDPRVRFCNLPTRGYRYPPTAENHWLAGPVVAANKALELVTGKWIARLDDDDIWTPDHIESLLRFAQEGDHEFVSAAYVAERHGQQITIDVKEETPRIGGTQTWLYRSYLKFFRYNIDCWRKSWNRVNDTDLQDRMYKAGVRMGFLDKIVAYVLPRPGENTIGLEAYRSTAKEKLRHFAFRTDEGLDGHPPDSTERNHADDNRSDP